MQDKTRDKADQSLGQEEGRVGVHLLNKYHVNTLVSPHLGNYGAENTARVGEYKGIPLLVASREGQALALACSVPCRNRSVGFERTPEGWRDLMRHKIMTWQYGRSEDGNVAMTGEIDLTVTKHGSFVLALGFGTLLKRN
jgi:glucoamylase